MDPLQGGLWRPTPSLLKKYSKSKKLTISWNKATLGHSSERLKEIEGKLNGLHASIDTYIEHSIVVEELEALENEHNDLLAWEEAQWRMNSR